VRSHELAVANTWVLVDLPVYVIAFVIAVVVPLALITADVPPKLRRAAWLANGIGAAGLLTLRTPGLLAALPLVPYAIVAILVGAIGIARLLARPVPASRMALAIGLVFLPAAATWLVSYQADLPLLGYAPAWVLLTALHFHIAGMALFVVVGRISHGRGRLAAAVAVACAVAMPLTAAGIHGPRALELVAALAMSAAGAGVGVLLLGAPRSLVARGTAALRIAGAALLVTMTFAAVFALREHVGALTLFGLDELATMVVVHGVPNAVMVGAVVMLALAGGGPPRDLVELPRTSWIATVLRIRTDSAAPADRQ
jgi:YndJ-like protein